MGMAASQARHLALVARKSNCEYEGQQINQARTALANQSANLFNQMLGLKVPVPPSTQDFTKIQYSFTDGINGSTITSWQQLATPEEDYNYVVTHHYNAKINTGSQKKLSDPQVQFSKGVAANTAEMTAKLKQLTSSKVEYDKIKSDYENIIKNYENAVKAQEEAQAAYDVALEVRKKAETARDEALAKYNEAKAATEAYTAEGSNYDTLKKAMEEAKTALDTERENAKILTNYQNPDNNWKYGVGGIEFNTGDGTYIGSTGSNDTVFYPYSQITAETDLGTHVTYDDINNSIQGLIDIGALPANFDKNNIYITAKDGTPAIAFKEDLDKGIIFQPYEENGATINQYTVPCYEVDPDLNVSIPKKIENFNTNIATYEAAYSSAAYNFSIAEAEYQGLKDAELAAKTAYDTAEAVFAEADLAYTTAEVTKNTADTALEKAKEEKENADEEYGPIVKAYETALAEYEALQSPEYIGNCELTLLESLTDNQAAELKQVVATMKELDINPAINDCFDADGNYLGGVYEFKLNGKTFYTSYAELYESYTSETITNNIDGQTKLNYYNAELVDTKIEKTEKALLETDGNGRFTSVRFENNTITYTLDMEPITDEAAYKDAMNQYNYENAVYDKTIQDINARTSIIQQQDQQLELRLKQLDTEHSALVAEIEAVSKVVKDNVDNTFKTFSG